MFNIFKIFTFSNRRKNYYYFDVEAYEKELTKQLYKTYPNYIKNTSKKFTRETAIKIIKGDFENHYGISLEKFIDEYKDIIETCPEKLI